MSMSRRPSPRWSCPPGYELLTGGFLDDLAGTIHPHATNSEGLLESADAALSQAIHTLNRG